MIPIKVLHSSPENLVELQVSMPTRHLCQSIEKHHKKSFLATGKFLWFYCEIWELCNVRLNSHLVALSSVPCKSDIACLPSNIYVNINEPDLSLHCKYSKCITQSVMKCVTNRQSQSPLSVLLFFSLSNIRNF
jgi:hypothetical protein